MNKDLINSEQYLEWLDDKEFEKKDDKMIISQLEKDLKAWQGFTSTKVIKILEIDRFNIKKNIPYKIDVIYSFSRETEDLLKVELKANIFNLKDYYFTLTI